MENIKTFSFKRIFLLMQKTVYENAKSILTGIITLFGIYSFILFISALNDGDAWANTEVFYYSGLIIGAIYVAGTAFTDFRSKGRTFSYLTLPASVLEKFIAEFLLINIGFFIGYTIVFYLFNTLMIIIGNFLMIDVHLANIFYYKSEIIKGIPVFFINQAIFLAGAATFRKAPLFKTISAMFIYGIFMTIILSLLFYSAKDVFTALPPYLGNHDIKFGISGTFGSELIPDKFQYLFYIILTVSFWAYTYFKLKEKEV